MLQTTRGPAVQQVCARCLYHASFLCPFHPTWSFLLFLRQLAYSSQRTSTVAFWPSAAWLLFTNELSHKLPMGHITLCTAGVISWRWLLCFVSWLLEEGYRDKFPHCLIARINCVSPGQTFCSLFCRLWNVCNDSCFSIHVVCLNARFKFMVYSCKVWEALPKVLSWLDFPYTCFKFALSYCMDAFFFLASQLWSGGREPWNKERETQTSLLMQPLCSACLFFLSIHLISW